MMVNNSCIAIGPNLQECASCHIGYGWVDAKFDFTDPANIDCLVCHDTTGTYRKDAGQRRPARPVAGPGRHRAEGGPAVAAGVRLVPLRQRRRPRTPSTVTSSRSLADPPADLDMHMGTLKMRCQDCHATAEHRIAGMSMSAPAVEGRVRCEKCHGDTPARRGGHAEPAPRRPRQGRRLRDLPHSRRSPTTSPTLLRRDYSDGRPGPARSCRTSTACRSTTSGSATLTWGKDIVPDLPLVRRHPQRLARGRHDRSRRRRSSSTRRSARSATRRRASSRSRSTRRSSPTTARTRSLALPKLVDGYWIDFDWSKAIADGHEAGRAPVLREVRLRRDPDVLGGPPRGGAGQEGARLRRLPQRRRPSPARAATGTPRDGPARAQAGGLSGGRRTGSTSRPWATRTIRRRSAAGSTSASAEGRRRDRARRAQVPPAAPGWAILSEGVRGGRRPWQSSRAVLPPRPRRCSGPWFPWEASRLLRSARSRLLALPSSQPASSHPRRSIL